MGSVPRFPAGAVPSPRPDGRMRAVFFAHLDPARNGAVPASVTAAPIRFAMAPEAQRRSHGPTHTGTSTHDDGENGALAAHQLFYLPGISCGTPASDSRGTRHRQRRNCHERQVLAAQSGNRSQTDFVSCSKWNVVFSQQPALQRPNATSRRRASTTGKVKP